jgi:hypothetical protein
MTLEGHIKDGRVILDTPVVLPEGTKVTISVQPNPSQVAKDEEFPTLYDRLKPVIGKAKGLPADLAINHDHYLHGQPKRQ